MNFSAVLDALSSMLLLWLLSCSWNIVLGCLGRRAQKTLTVSSGNHPVRRASAEGQRGYLFNILLFLRFS